MANEISSIDKSLTDCLAKKENYTTASMNNCVIKANALYDKQISSLYTRLEKHLTGQAKLDLRASQKAWIIFRDAERVSIASIFSNIQGTMYTNIRAMDILSISKNRATALNSYAQAIGI